MENYLKKIIKNTPKVEPYYSEVVNAAKELESSEKSPSNYAHITHGYICAKYKANDLSNNFKTSKFKDGVIITHKDFLNTQDSFGKLEKGTVANKWNSNKAIKALKHYLNVLSEYRKKHEKIFNNSFKNLPEEEQEFINKHKKRWLNRQIKENIIIGLPIFYENNKLYSNYIGISIKDLKEATSPWAKMAEQGLIYSSKKYRDDNPRGHDYFSYAYRAVKSGEVNNIEDKLLLTGKHEGSHWIIDGLTRQILNLHDANPLYEGIPGALGNDGREMRKTKVTLNNLLANPMTNLNIKGVDNYSYDVNYIAAPRYFRCLIKLIKEENPWSLVTTSILHEVIKESKNKKSKNIKVSNVLTNTLKQLNIDKKEIKQEYNEMNIKPRDR